MAGFGIPVAYGRAVPKPAAPKPVAPKAAKPAKPVQVKAHTRAPASKPPKTAKPVSPLLDPNQALSGSNLLNAAKQLANTQTQGPLAELQRQIAANNAQTQGTVKLVGGYYNQLEPFVQQGVTNSGNIGSGLNSQLAGIGTDTQNQLAGLGQSDLANLQKYAPPGDGSTSTAATGDLAAQIARQQGLAAQESGTYRSFGANQGANYQGAANSNLGSYGLQGQEALRGIGQSGTVKNQPLVQKIADLQASKGSVLATDLGKLRQQEIDNQVTRAGLGLKQDTLQTTAANDKARNTIAEQNANTAAARVKVTAQNDAANQSLKQAGINTTRQNDLANQHIRQEAIDAKNTGSPQKPLTPNENNRANVQINNIMSAIRTWQQDGIKNGKGAVIEPHPTNAQMRQVLGNQYSSPQIEAAFDLLGWGHLTPATAQALHQMGIRGTTYQGKPVRVAPPPSNKQRDTTGGVPPGIKNPLGATI